MERKAVVAQRFHFYARLGAKIGSWDAKVRTAEDAKKRRESKYSVLPLCVSLRLDPPLPGITMVNEKLASPVKSVT